MKKILLAAVACAAIATPALARDGAGYVGVEGGILFPRDSHLDLTASGSLFEAPVAPATTGTTTPFNETYNNGLVADFKRGLDIDAIAGFDFGFFRLEGELGYKRAKVRRLSASSGLLADLSDANGAPVTNTDLGLDFDLNSKTTVLSGMVNGLVDFAVAPGVSLYAGGGVGRARVKIEDAKDNAWAWQLIAGASTALSPNIDLGLKYRYFQTGRLRYSTTDAGSFDDGAGNVLTINSVGAATKFRSHSLLASLIFNFGSPAVAPPPPPPMVEMAPPPPPPPPATQTCPDGSVIDATATCPVPPPPPAPPAKGERG